jgi:hypothetical protein
MSYYSERRPARSRKPEPATATPAAAKPATETKKPVEKPRGLGFLRKAALANQGR